MFFELSFGEVSAMPPPLEWAVFYKKRPPETHSKKGLINLLHLARHSISGHQDAQEWQRL